MAKKSTTQKQPTNRDLQRLRHHELIRTCIGKADGEITFDEVRSLYEGWSSHWRARQETSDLKAHFKKDCTTLVEHFAEFVHRYLSPFFLPAPILHFDKKKEVLSIVSGLRPIAKDKNAKRELIPRRRALARFVTSASDHQQNTILPRSGRVYIGHGSTLCICFHELLCETREKIPNLTVYTASFEVAQLLYSIHQGAGASQGGIRFGENLRVDREMGAILPHGDKNDIGQIDVAIISCHGLYRGKFYSKADQRTHEYSRPYLENADRIVIIVDDYKVGVTDGDEITIPGLGTDKKILVVSDSNESKIREHLPPNVELKLAPPMPIGT